MRDLHSLIADLCQAIVLEKNPQKLAKLGMQLYELLREEERRNFLTSFAELEKTTPQRPRQLRAS